MSGFFSSAILSSRSDASLNTQHSKSTTPMDADKHWSPAGGESTTVHSSSSPFQSHIDQENQPPASNQSPSTSSPLARFSPHKVDPAAHFDIYDDSTAPEAAKDSPPRRTSPLRQEVTAEPETQTMDVDDNLSIVSDDTCFSNFSAVPNADMTLFARLGNKSPTRKLETDYTAGHTVFQTPRTSRKASNGSTSPTSSRRSRYDEDNDTTSLLIDFTQQFGRNSVRSASPTKTQTAPNLLSYLNDQRRPSPSKSNTKTPVKSSRQSLMHLLDFELPPQPTPRSIPTITIRELESLKSQYLSEISSLKASLSGRDAEVKSLKTAVADAEFRCGEAQEQAREQRSMREHAESEKAEWEKKGREVEEVLQNVKAEFLESERESEELNHKLEDAVRAREEAEAKLAEAMAAARSSSSETSASASGSADIDNLVQQKVASQLDEKMENLARELHAVYKKKHETKVAKLKETYELKAEKKSAELQRKVDELTKSNTSLQASTRISPSKPRESPDNTLASELQTQKAKVAGLLEEMATVKHAQTQLLAALEQERVEKGELVAAVDEMLALQAEVGAPNAIEDFKRSISRPPTLTPDTPSLHAAAMKAEGKFVKPSLPQPSSSSNTGLPVRGSAAASAMPVAAKSRMMSNIERMGGKKADE